MLKESNTFSSFSVKDTAEAKKFYKDKLGLDVQDEDMPGIISLVLAGNNKVMVYPKPDHTPATFTVLNFLVNDVEKTVDELTAQGVEFIVYDNENIKTDKKGILRSEGPVIAWFADPFGNIMSVIEQH
jgi:predicted enzyme related to lactoylglutathione lyase